MSRHRHALAWVSISDPRLYDPVHKWPPDTYQYCSICGCVPTTLLGKDPPLRTDSNAARWERNVRKNRAFRKQMMEKKNAL